MAIANTVIHVWPQMLYSNNDFLIYNFCVTKIKYKVQDYNTNAAHPDIYARVGILLACGEQLHDHIISLGGKFWPNELV